MHARQAIEVCFCQVCLAGDAGRLSLTSGTCQKLTDYLRCLPEAENIRHFIKGLIANVMGNKTGEILGDLGAVFTYTDAGGFFTDDP